MCHYLERYFILCTTGPLTRARTAVEAFHQQEYDFAIDAGTMRRLCPALGLAHSQSVIASLSTAPRLMLINAMSFLLVVVAFADAAVEVSLLPFCAHLDIQQEGSFHLLLYFLQGLEAKFELLFDAHDISGSGRFNLDELVFLLVHITQVNKYHTAFSSHMVHISPSRFHTQPFSCPLYSPIRVCWTAQGLHRLVRTNLNTLYRG